MKQRVFRLMSMLCVVASMMLAISCSEEELIPDGNVEVVKGDFTLDSLRYVINSDLNSVSVTCVNKRIKKVVIPAIVTHNGRKYYVTSIEANAFKDCTSLDSISLPSGVRSIGDYAFHRCTSLDSISLPSGVRSIGLYAFCHCTHLTSISIPGSVTSIRNAAFSECTRLTSISIPAGVTEINTFTFHGCTSLTSVVIPPSVTSIEGWSFVDCTSLDSIDIPSGVKSIELKAFQGCTSLTDVTCRATKAPKLGSGVFSGINLKDATLRVPSSAVKAYKAAGQWNDFKEIRSL